MMNKPKIIYHLVEGEYVSATTEIPVVDITPDKSEYQFIGHKNNVNYKLDVYVAVWEKENESVLS